MDLGLTGRVAIVAAASKGLGRAVAEELASEGAHVAICARTASTLEETAGQSQKATGREVFHRALDVTDSKAITDFVAAVETRFGRLDICVTNSGGPPSNLFKNTPPEAWRAALDQLLMSTINFGKGSSAAHAEEQVGTSDYDYLVGGQAARRRTAALEFDPRRGHRAGAHAGQ